MFSRSNFLFHEANLIILQNKELAKKSEIFLNEDDQ